MNLALLNNDNLKETNMVRSNFTLLEPVCADDTVILDYPYLFRSVTNCEPQKETIIVSYTIPENQTGRFRGFAASTAFAFATIRLYLNDVIYHLSRTTITNPNASLVDSFSTLLQAGTTVKLTIFPEETGKSCTADGSLLLTTGPVAD